MKLNLLLPLVTFTLMGVTLWLLTLVQQPEPSLEIHMEAPSHEESSSTPPSLLQEQYQKALSRLSESLKQQSDLKQQVEALSTTLEAKGTIQKQLDDFYLGRAVLSAFTQKLGSYETLLEGKSFFNFLQGLVQNYTQHRRVSLQGIHVEDESYPLLKRELTEWIIKLEDQKVGALANLTAIALVEPLYNLPLTLLASSLITDIEAIDYDSPVFIQEQSSSPQRDSKGELIVSQPARLEFYSHAQQFFYRRGPVFSSKVVLFLRVYLTFEAIR
ncbi:hypothetical protein WDW89_02655 [Deltaproteobacteria bacterium TL4]